MLGRYAVGHAALPAVFAVRQMCGKQAQVARGLLGFLRQSAPVFKPACVLQAAGKQVAAVVEQVPRGELLPQKLHANGVELVGFVKNHRVYAGQQLGHARFAHG